MKKKIILEVQVNENEEQKIIDLLVSSKIEHNLYTFCIGTIGSQIREIRKR